MLKWNFQIFPSDFSDTVAKHSRPKGSSSAWIIFFRVASMQRPLCHKWGMEIEHMMLRVLTFQPSNLAFPTDWMRIARMIQNLCINCTQREKSCWRPAKICPANGPSATMIESYWTSPWATMPLSSPMTTIKIRWAKNPVNETNLRLTRGRILIEICVFLQNGMILSRDGLSVSLGAWIWSCSQMIRMEEMAPHWISFCTNRSKQKKAHRVQTKCRNHQSAAPSDFNLWLVFKIVYVMWTFTV